MLLHPHFLRRVASMRQSGRAVGDLPPASFDSSLRVIDEEIREANLSLRGVDAVEAARMRVDRMSHDLREGRERYETMRRALMKLKGNLDSPYGRSVDQIRIHRIIMQNSLAQIYPNFKRNADAVMWEHGVDKVKPYILVGMPRRTGKTQTVAMFVAAYLVAMPKKKVVIFSQNINTSTEMIKRVAFYGEQLAPGCFISGASDKLFYSKSKDKKDVARNSEVHARPSGGDNNRGMGGDLIIAEEVEYMPRATVDVAIAPAMSKEDTILIAITSNPRSSTSSLYFELASKKDTRGEPIFHEFRVQKLCKSCEKEGLDVCPHNANRVPPWISKTPEVALALMSSKDIYRTEILGVSVETETRCFSDEQVDALFSRVRSLYSRPLFGVISIDPSGGCVSDTGIVSMVISANGQIMVRFFFSWTFLSQTPSQNREPSLAPR